MKANGTAKTQSFANELHQAGYDGLLVRSFASGSTPQDLNLVLWRWRAVPPAYLELIDDEGCLTR